MSKILGNRIYISLLLLLAGCTSENEKNQFSGVFTGYWAETSWQYKFHPNSEFEFKSEGHFGFVGSKGKYLRNLDSLFLVEIDTYLVKFGVVNSLYLIAGDSCIIDHKLKYDYCKTKNWSQKRTVFSN